ncbi:cytochrome c oxidase subunit transmembrane protein [Burkholderia lata]|uniref:cbb3-type cytochrome c oxidase subunit I n=1 Tax=Burkholderia lata (strain ATCC 17760 / DSM 23089 / LMG 22485 / NCIMB 9086 / R18194 / 383) TaxID=482957 RepID=UPI001452C42E|nr:cbb3-type cytochrome c oxidase subunit I [Burkholderia lata]VWD34788.1 cytochrome c oxidase subunit transmembrane protein [Burkholderia lata]
MSTVAILLSAFIISVVGLLVFIVSVRYGLLDGSQKAAEVIFARGEIGRTEEPAVTEQQRSALQAVAGQAQMPAPSPPLDEDLSVRAEADHSSSLVVFIFLCSAMTWLLVASLAGLTASLKLHMPDALASQAWLTFGRVRTVHLNAVAYGWAPMAGLGIALFVLPRVLKTRLVGANYALLGAMMWNAGLVAGLGSIAVGLSDGMEWLEIPWQIGIVFAVGGALIGMPLVLTLLSTRVTHLYVSVWYMGCALFWFPVLYLVAKVPFIHFGVEQATTNWWFGHSVLGLFYTPLALASVYYFLPKIIGRPIQSYGLSLLGFWTLAFFYGQVGGHHLIGGPVPGWMVTLSIVQSMMMIIPVIAFTVNLHQTMKGHFRALLYSPTLRFVTLGGMMYTLSSLQGSFEALRSVNAITHFTHFTVAHAHLGLYAFVSFVFFGAIYFIVPRITRREWPYPGLIAAHFWCAAVGVGIYFVALTIAGTLQGLAMLDAARPFIESVALTVPYLKARSLGGGLMVLGHLCFIANFVCVILGLGPNRDKPAMFPIAGMDNAGAGS